MITMKATDPAFPLNYGIDFAGLTKREYMATHIAAGLAADPQLVGDLGSVAVYLADKLIDALSKE